MIYDPDKIAEIFLLKGKNGQKAVLKDYNLQACCPFKHYKAGHGFHYERNPSFGIHLVSGAWNCYGCGKKGKDLQSLASALSIDLPVMFRTYNADEYIKEKDEFFDYTLEMFTINQDKANNYLEGRGINGVVSKYNIGMSSNEQHLYMPMHNNDGKFYGWVERNMSGVGARYMLKPEGINRKEVLYGVAQLDKTSKVGAFVESPMDALKLASLGDNALASCGAAVTDEQLESLLDYFTTIYLIPQNDDPGKVWLKKCKNILFGRCVLYVVNLPSKYKDIAEITSEDELKYIFKKGTKLVR